MIGREAGGYLNRIYFLNYLKPPPSYCAWLRSLLTLFLSSRVSGNTMLKPALTSADGWSSVGGAEGGRSINRYLGKKSIKAFLTQGAILWVAGVRKFTFNTAEHVLVNKACDTK